MLRTVFYVSGSFYSIIHARTFVVTGISFVPEPNGSGKPVSRGWRAMRTELEGDMVDDAALTTKSIYRNSVFWMQSFVDRLGVGLFRRTRRSDRQSCGNRCSGVV